ncbi:MAG TPA: hypothetical protein VFH55_01610 [Nitrospiria bacterium]|nr:hypothetical protein [Nitrospiria bacterium]
MRSDIYNETNDPGSSGKRHARLRAIGVIVFLLGMSGAALVYWLGTRSPDLTDNPLMAGMPKVEARQMGYLYGKMGLVILHLQDNLSRPGTQAILIAAISTLIAFGCFYFARSSDDDDKTR